MTGHDAGVDRGGRLVSLDAYRGFVMLLMATGGLGIGVVAQDFPDSQLWQAIDRHAQHAIWRGCTVWDLIQPSFMFIVGVAMPFSYASRRAQGQSWWRLFRHAVWRSVVLVALGVFLASAWAPRTNFVFTNVLAQIGLGYTIVFLMLGRPAWVQLAFATLILVGYWGLFASYPLPDARRLGPEYELPQGWESLTGFAAHWEKNANVAARFDRWFLNLFPRPDGRTFTYSEGGYTTLNFVPSIATMLFGVLAGEWLRSGHTPRAKLQGLLIVGALAIVAGTALDPDTCPIVKRIWTPSWVIFSTGWTCGLLAVFYGVVDVAGYRRLAFPLVVVGVNSIAMYLMAQLLKGFIVKQFRIHLGPEIFRVVYQGTDYGPIVESVAIVAVLWLICLGMYRQKIFVKI